MSNKKKLNWSCTTCGMSSGRKSSVKRHIENYNIHNGVGQIVSLIEYSFGRREGRYQPQEPYLHVRPQIHFLSNIREKTLKELEELIVKEIARRIYVEIPADKINYIETRIKPEIVKILLNQGGW